MERAISNEEGRRLAASWNAGFLETSAKQNEVSVVSKSENQFTVFIVGAFM